MPQTLQLILILLGAAVVAVVLCRLVRLPPILGYLLVGLAVGPHALALVPESADVRDLAEFGIVFLMFSIGLEFSLPQLKALGRAVLGLRLAQGGGGVGAHPFRWPKADAGVVPRRRAAEESRALHAEPSARDTRTRGADRACRAVAGARSVSRRHADRRDRIPLSGRGGHQ